jgi:hypothetical protein
MTTAELLQLFVGLLVGGDILATVAMRGKLSSIAADLRLAMTQLNEHSTTLAVQDGRIARLEAEFAAQKVRYEDLAGFLQGSGYRKREGP